MKKVLVFLCLSLGLNGGAQASPAQIKALSCSSIEGTLGLTKVSLVGTYLGRAYLNITNVNQFGVPFTQQAEIINTTLAGGNLVLGLRTVVTRGDLRLVLDSGTNHGRLSAVAGGSAIEMTCSADVQTLD